MKEIIMVQVFFVDAEGKSDSSFFWGNYEIIGDPVYGDALTGEIEFLDKIAAKAGVTPISHFIDTEVTDDDSVLSLSGHWSCPHDGIRTLDSLLDWLDGRWKAPLNKPTSRRARQLLGRGGPTILVEELLSLRDYIHWAAKEDGARFKLRIF